MYDTPEEWNKEYAVHPLQTWEWGEVRAKTNKISRVNGYLVVWSKIPLSPWYFGYVPKSAIPNDLEILELKEEARRVNGVGIRFEPITQVNEEVTQKDYEHKLNKLLVRGRPFFTDKTFYLDLTKSEEELLAAMHPKARYNIRLAQKREVKIVEDNSDEAFEEYWKLMEETTTRHKFFAHDKQYHQNMWTVMKDKVAHLFVAKYKDEVIAAWIVWKYGDKLYYPYGASTDKHKEVMAPSLMLWETAKWGKANGCKVYDLWVADENKGFTRFKEQFGPELIKFVGTYDLIVNPIPYWLFRAAEEIRWTILKLRT